MRPTDPFAWTLRSYASMNRRWGRTTSCIRMGTRASAPPKRLKAATRECRPVRIQKRHGHATGGDASWRTYDRDKAVYGRRATAQPAPVTESWWMGLGREACAAEVARRHGQATAGVLLDRGLTT